MAHTVRQAQRQQERTRGRYHRMRRCPRCRRPGALEPAYSQRDGGRVPDNSPWAGGYLCVSCLALVAREGS